MHIDNSVKQHLFEVFEEVSTAPTREKAVEVLKANDSLALRDVLKATFDPTVKWLVEPDVKFVKNKIESVPSTLLRNSDKFKFLVFFNSGPNTQYNKLSAEKRKNIFVGLLESIHPNDADIVIEAVQKKSSYKHVTATNAKAAFPGLWSDDK